MSSFDRGRRLMLIPENPFFLTRWPLFSKNVLIFDIAWNASFLLWNTPDQCSSLTSPLLNCTALPRDLAKQPLFKLGGPTGRAQRLSRILNDYFKINPGFARSAKRPVFRLCFRCIDTGSCCDSLPLNKALGADCGTMAKPCRLLRSELAAMAAHHPSRTSKHLRCKNAVMHATTCVMSFY